MQFHHTALLFPLLAQVALTVAIYVRLMMARKVAVARGELQMSSFVLNRDEPIEVARVTRNLANQYELPVLFYAAILAIVATDSAGPFDHVIAWIFVVSRVAHALAQTTTNNVPLRGQCFAVGFLATIALFGHVALIAIRGA